MIKIGIFIGVSIIVQALVIRQVKKHKLYQQIYKLSPKSHQKKTKTPSFGGIAIILNLLIGMAMFDLWTLKLIWLLGLVVGFAGIGLLDDSLSSISQKNKGLSIKQKFGLQCVVALISLVTYHIAIAPLSIWILCLALVMMVGAPNATNLTDGLDGLLSGLGIITLAGFWVLFYQKGAESEALFSMILLISLGSLLVFNWNPAKIFMGDTGALAIGAGFAGLALLYENPWILLSLGAVYIIETCSVMLQVSYYKLTKKRLFKMAPLHHHFEELGLSEKRTVILFWAIGIGFSLLVLLK